MSEIRLVLDKTETEKVETLKTKYKVSKGTDLLRFLLTKAYAELDVTQVKEQKAEASV